MRRCALAGAILIALGSGCGGDESAVLAPRLEPWKLDVWEPGIVDNRVWAIHEDRNGALWFATFGGGVSRYEPTTGIWKSFTTRDGLASDSVLTIHEDSHGALWFAMGYFTGARVSRYQPATETWETFEWRASDFVWAIHEDSHGALWFSTWGEGVSHYDPTSETWKTFTTRDGLADNHVEAIHEDSHGALWFATFGRGVSRHQPVADTWKSFTTNDGLADNDVVAIQEDSHGALWFATDGGVSRYQPATGKWQTFTTRDGLAGNNVRAIHEDSHGALWFATFGGGVSRYQPATGIWKSFTTRDGLAFDEVRAIHEDSQGTLWFATGNTWEIGSVSRYEPATDTWKILTTRNGLTNDSVQAIHEDSHGALWFATDGGGVSLYQPATGAWKSFSTHDELVDNHVEAIHEDSHGTLWFATWEGVSRYQPATGAWKSFSTHDGLADPHVDAIHEDSHGALWFATGAGVSRYKPATGTWKTFTTSDGLAFDSVRAIHENSHGTLWFATGAGVSRYKPATGTWKTFTTSDGLASDSVRAIHEDSHGALWFATDGGGVSLYQPATGAWKSFSTHDGLASDYVQSIHEDRHGTLWFATYEGVSRYQPATGAWKTFTIRSGLTDVATVRAIHEDSHGALWFVTYEGVSRYQPTHGSWLTLREHTPPAFRIMLSPSLVVITRQTGLSIHTASDARTMRWSPAGARATALAPGPANRVWVGTLLGGLVLRGPDTDDVFINREHGLPSMTVTALAPIPSETAVWVGTTAGPALVRLTSSGNPQVTLPAAELPPGPVDALAVDAQGTAYVAYNAIEAKQFLDNKERAKRRAQTQIWRIPPQSEPERIAISTASHKELARSTIHALAFSPKHGLWVGTSAGLFRAPDGVGPVTKETGQGRLPPVAIQRLAVAPDRHGTVWMAVNGKDDSLGYVLGYRPGTDTIFTLTQDQGVPEADTIDDLAFTGDGHLVVYAANKLARGRVFVPVPPGSPFPWLAASLALLAVLLTAGAFVGIVRHPMVLRLRARPLDLHKLGLATAGVAIRRLRRARALAEVWQRLGLQMDRARMLERFAALRRFEPRDACALAVLLGMRDARPEHVQALTPGLMAMALRLPDPWPLRGHTIALFAWQPEEVTATPAELRRAMEQAMERMEQRPEHPYLLLSRTDVPGDMRPGHHDGLVIAEAELRTLLLSRSPADALAGFLITRGLFSSLSPYSTAGEVKDERMFFGRTRLLRELVQTSSLQHIIVGPRRVGKSSLLRRLAKVLGERRPEVDVTFLDLLGVTSARRAAIKLARALDMHDLGELADEASEDTLFVDILRRRHEQDGRARVVLIDELDALVHADAARGYPLLEAMRSLQAGGGCSFVITGFGYLHRQTLDQRSPLYNFATVTQLGPLEPEAARELASVPMGRIGIRYADRALPARIAEVTGGYPSLVQQLCMEMLKKLSAADLVITADMVSATEHSSALLDYLEDIVGSNTQPVARIVALELSDREDFRLADVDALLQRVAGAPVPLHLVEEVLRLLRLAGFVAAQDGAYRWAIPLLRQMLQATDSHVRERLIAELPADPARWLVVPQHAPPTA